MIRRRLSDLLFEAAIRIEPDRAIAYNLQIPGVTFREAGSGRMLVRNCHIAPRFTSVSPCPKGGWKLPK